MRCLTGYWRFGWLAAGLLLTQNLTLLLWGSLERVDALALCLTLVGLALFTLRRSSAAAVFFVLAFFTKQTFLVAPVAAAIALWPCRPSLARFTAVVVCGVVGGVALAQWLTQGWFWWHVVTANANPLDMMTFSVLMGSFLQFNGVPVLAALVSLTLPAAPGERVLALVFRRESADLADGGQAGRFVELLGRAHRRDARPAGAGEPSTERRGRRRGSLRRR